MNAWYLLSAPAWLLIAITAAARLHDMTRDQWKRRHHVRRLGLIGVGFVASLQLVAPFLLGAWRFYPGEVATWQSFIFGWSWTFVWLTTPNMLPWWDFILGVHRNTGSWGELTRRERIRAELRALANSFKPYRKRKPLPGDAPREFSPW